MGWPDQDDSGYRRDPPSTSLQTPDIHSRNDRANETRPALHADWFGHESRGEAHVDFGLTGGRDHMMVGLDLDDECLHCQHHLGARRSCMLSIGGTGKYPSF